MPYEKLSELPLGVRNNLPKAAQEIYRKAYNNAWEQYADPRKRHLGGSREETANRVAWSAVKRVYKKDEKSGKWKKKQSRK